MELKQSVLALLSRCLDLGIVVTGVKSGLVLGVWQILGVPVDWGGEQGLPHPFEGGGVPVTHVSFLASPCSERGRGVEGTRWW